MISFGGRWPVQSSGSEFSKQAPPTKSFNGNKPQNFINRFNYEFHKNSHNSSSSPTNPFPSTRLLAIAIAGDEDHLTNPMALLYDDCGRVIVSKIIQLEIWSCDPKGLSDPTLWVPSPPLLQCSRWYNRLRFSEIQSSSRPVIVTLFTGPTLMVIP